MDIPVFIFLVFGKFTCGKLRSVIGSREFQVKLVPVFSVPAVRGASGEHSLNPLAFARRRRTPWKQWAGGTRAGKNRSVSFCPRLKSPNNREWKLWCHETDSASHRVHVFIKLTQTAGQRAPTAGEQISFNSSPEWIVPQKSLSAF